MGFCDGYFIWWKMEAHSVFNFMQIEIDYCKTIFFSHCQARDNYENYWLFWYQHWLSDQYYYEQVIGFQ